MPLDALDIPDADSQARGVPELLTAMGRGERQAAAEFVNRYGPQIRRRVRQVAGFDAASL